MDSPQLCSISPETISLVLHFIAPPSQLTAPIPSHLVSRPLLQRHHFLNIDPSHPAEYLAWPSPSQQKAVHLLDTLISHPSPSHNYPVQYVVDPESIYAHVRITSEPSEPTSALRLIFLWDKSCGWQYHDLSLMPFPPNSHPSLENVLEMFHSPGDFLQETPYSFTQPQVSSSLDSDDGDGPSYWDAYGATDHDLHDGDSFAAPIKDTPSDSEDAYWAQYASVHGSGDSTLPSPLPRKANLGQPAPGAYVSSDPDATERIIISSGDLRIDISQTEVYNPLEPPSPGNLSRRLEAISPRPVSPPLIDESPVSTDSDTISPQPDPSELNSAPD
ncbi:hypothetical protein BDQ17DRAFT_1268860, partial [Cyathus striatus]